ncbi:hypothetical protein BV22DRAFT_1026787 [Leucogyrophana mollusca]|uniref:Uncharacterized protein n=1 Tax=Leucogyrophana mollusca TaxID=85980 RepID=A0ACB8AW86_9AGAM|nr:hypothetical protein BV22DRAFT_1026787 [Leucogyrophana mollusca]
MSTSCNIRLQIDALLGLTSEREEVYVPVEVKASLESVLQYFETHPLPPASPRTSSSSASSQRSLSPPTLRSLSPCGKKDTAGAAHLLSTSYKVPSTKKTLLDVLYHYSRGVLIEYPETTLTPTGSVGHLFEMDPEDWFNPVSMFAYSQGSPRGGTNKGAWVTCEVLKDENGELVPCREVHSTCQGIKIRPFADRSTMSQLHCRASRDDLRHRLEIDCETRKRELIPYAELRQKTLSLFVALKKNGCGAPPFEIACDPVNGTTKRSEWDLQLEKSRRGHEAKAACDGRLIFEYDRKGIPFVQCEHHDRQKTVDHFFSYNIGNGLYDIEYLEALFQGDVHSDDDNNDMDYSHERRKPEKVCTTVANFSSIKVACPCEHYNGHGELTLAEMERMPCNSITRMYEPLVEYRSKCPRILVVCRGPHSHPIPLPTKTPPAIQAELMSLLKSLDQDLPDLTTRRFLRHPIIQSYLRHRLPALPYPAMSDLHPSLANKDHIQSYIQHAKGDCFPAGTGWEGERLFIFR